MLSLFEYNAEPLNIDEQTELQTQEAIIQRGINTFVEVGIALLAIRDRKLYRESHLTFEQYCQERWGWERRHAYRLIDAAQAVENVSHGTQIIPTSERQARPLTVLEPELQQAAWQQAVDTAPEGKITAAHVQSVVDEIQNKPHVSHNSGNNEWYTPKEYIDAARSVLGEIDLDPASSEIANRTVQAKQFYTQDDDGLSHSWFGRVWLNPPYSSDKIGDFVEKLEVHFVSGDITEAIVLVNNATETGWFQLLLFNASAICLPRGRVKFIDMAGNPSGAPLQGQAVLYLGKNPGIFADNFSDFGMILYAGRTRFSQE